MSCGDGLARRAPSTGRSAVLQDYPRSVLLLEAKHDSAAVAVRSADLHRSGCDLKRRDVRGGGTGHLDLLDLNLNLLRAICAETTLQLLLLQARIDALDCGRVQFRIAVRIHLEGGLNARPVFGGGSSRRG